MEIKVAVFAKVAIIGKQTAVYLYSGTIPGLKGSKKKAHFYSNIAEIVSLSVAIFCQLRLLNVITDYHNK